MPRRAAERYRTWAATLPTLPQARRALHPHVPCENPQPLAESITPSSQRWTGLRALRRWGDGVRRGRREVQELLRERRDEVVDDRLHPHQRGRPPLLINDGDMPIGAAIHLV